MIGINNIITCFFADMCPKNASYYGNRAATLMMLCRYREALEDSQQAVRLDNDFTKVSCISQPSLSLFNNNIQYRYNALVFRQAQFTMQSCTCSLASYMYQETYCSQYPKTLVMI